MENELKAKRKRTPRPEKLTLSTEAMDKFIPLYEEANSKLKGVRLTPSQFMSFYITHQQSSLSDDQIQSLCADFFDEVKFAEWAIDELKASIKRGENKTYLQILEENRPKITVINKCRMPESLKKNGSARKKKAAKYDDSPLSDEIQDAVPKSDILDGKSIPSDLFKE